MTDERVLRAFVAADGRLHAIPSTQAKLLVVLDHLAQSFEPERRVDLVLGVAALERFHPDYAALRRYLVDESFLTRDGGVYWRSGGTVHLDDLGG